jgi:hypothetical protein
VTADDCQRLRDSAAELALGITDGAERAWALEHLARCPECRAHVERLANVADDLLAIAPWVEPPRGFEGRVAAALEPAAPRRRGARRLAIPVAAALAGAALAAAAVWVGLGDDRELAGEYREALAVADGEYFTAAPLEAPGGKRVGYVYGYQGRASWAMALVYDGVPRGKYAIDVVAADGAHQRIRTLAVDAEGRGSAGAALPFDYHDAAEIRLLDGRGREVADAELGE